MLSSSLLALRPAARTPAVTMREAAFKPGATAPSYLDGTFAADAGCDPLCLAALATPVSVVPFTRTGASMLDRYLPFAWSVEQREEIMAARTPKEQKATIAWMREAEIKHARLAMLAVIGWPLAELINPFNALGYVGGKAPALLNGGLDAFAPFMLVVAGVAGYLELQTVDDVYQTYLYKQDKERVQGDMGFDPLGLSKQAGSYEFVASAEIYNGRLAMLAITGFALQEFVWGKPVVEQTPMFFKSAFW